VQWFAINKQKQTEKKTNKTNEWVIIDNHW